MHTVFALLCFVVVIHWLIFPYPSGLLHWHCGNLTIAPVPAKQPWWIWINTSFKFIMNDYMPTTKQSTTKPCAYFLGYIVLDQATEIKCMMVLHPVHRVPLCIIADGEYNNIELLNSYIKEYSISQEICTRFLLCCALLWLYIDWFSHIHQAYFTGTVAIWRLPQCQQGSPDEYG